MNSFEKIRVSTNKDFRYGFKLVCFERFLEKENDYPEKIGYLNVSWIPKSTWDSTFENILEYLFWIEDWKCLSKSKSDFSPLTKSQMKEMAMLRNSKLSLGEMLIHISENYYDKQQKFKNKWVDKPSVGYVNVYKEHRCKGYGKELYLWASAWLWENHKLELHSGLTKTNEGQWLWDSIIREHSDLVEENSGQYKLKKLLT